MDSKTKEMIDALLAISTVAERLATNLAKEDKHYGSDDGADKRSERTYCCVTEVYITND